MGANPLGLLPEILLLAGAVAGLAAGTFAPRERQGIVAWICGAALVAALGATAAAAGGPSGMSFAVYASDALTDVTRGTVSATTLLVIVLARGWVRNDRRETEVYVLILLAALGTIILAGAGDLLVFVAAYTLASVPAYALAGFGKDAHGTEAALKYYLMGAFLGVLMLAGVTLLYGLSGATDYLPMGERLAYVPGAAVTCAAVLLLAGVLFKAGAVPAHFWIPDVAQGASPVIAAFVTTVPKIGAFVALYRMAAEIFAGVGSHWSAIIVILATATMTLGNLAAFHQDNVRRLLAYSTVSQAGYLLVPVAVAGHGGLARTAVLFYVAGYAITNLGAFAVVVATRRDTLADYSGLARRSPGLALALVVCLLGLVGTPPTAVFIGKVLVLTAAWDAGYGWLAVVVVVNTVASVFYYLRWIVPVFTRADVERPAGGEEAGEAAPTGIACLAAVISVLLGCASGIVFALG
ncbi:NADH-quinone oxidoreductase subunit N [Microtetraspora sp. AC03309]|uniref:NADH-quinone oxidoreductase subunit N n=1 Tax=Microtetraspora sp. AC03309 TaxID=2779376 RepID=UPI001E5CF112|nr:NADH-quinone oxidoreductase subunit N [Microtetraspora sp. AC03309]MCC5577726.1 NADH-quinone oxidoreductase subunit N [Microtetraspora sp. AC03309]